jgi:DNA-binding protein HU-beta
MLLRKDIIDKLSQEGYTKKDSAVILDDIVKIISQALVDGEGVRLHGFGTFEVIEHKSKETIDPQSKQRITVPAYKHPKFTAGKHLKRAVKEGFIRN